jgi:hypothetical protein
MADPECRTANMSMFSGTAVAQNSSTIETMKFIAGNA